MDGGSDLPSISSPRFSVRTAEFAAIERAIRDTGHAVIDDLWNPAYLTSLRERRERRFADDDALFARGYDGFPSQRVDRYLSGCLGIEDLSGAMETKAQADIAKRFDREFFEELERTGIAPLYRHLLGGDFVVERTERVIRRVDPAFPLRFAGLHCDGQLNLCSTKGLRSQREFTLWTPLRDCSTNDVPRLLLLQRGERYDDILSAADQVEVNGARYFPIQLRPHQIRDESRNVAALAPKIDEMFRRIFQSKRCYAPMIPLGSAVLFDKDIWHGSYYSSSMTQPRLSLDFRAVGEYTADDTNQRHHGMLFGAVPYPPLHPARPIEAARRRSWLRRLARRLLRPLS